MNKIVAYSAGAILLLGMVARILAAALFPDRFARGARKVLFLDARHRALFPSKEQTTDSRQDSCDHPDHLNNNVDRPPDADQEREG